MIDYSLYNNSLISEESLFWKFVRWGSGKNYYDNENDLDFLPYEYELDRVPVYSIIEDEV